MQTKWASKSEKAEKKAEDEKKPKEKSYKTMWKSLIPGIHVDSDLDENAEKSDAEEKSDDEANQQVMEGSVISVLASISSSKLWDENVAKAEAKKKAEEEKKEKDDKEKSEDDEKSDKSDDEKSDKSEKGELMRHQWQEDGSLKEVTEIEKNDVVKLNWIGSRSGKKIIFEAKETDIVEDFMTLVFNDCHGCKIDPEKYKSEQDWTAKHNIKFAKSGTIIDRSLTFIANGITNHGIPYDITFVLGLSGGGI